ncbi:hypothetical protein GC170_09675 [bacterium]|nr:hypothetical protein [bacterium]
MPKLAALTLDSTHVKDSDFAYVKSARSLEYLSAGATSLTEEGLALISENPGIISLWIWRTVIGGESLDSLKKMKNLYYLQCWNTLIRPEHLRELNDALPDCNIENHKPDAAYYDQ